MSLNELLCQISTFLAAGHETSSSALTWTLYALSRCPSAQTKLREELREEARSGFVADHLTGRDTLVLVPTNEAAAELASHIRGELVALGRVEPERAVREPRREGRGRLEGLYLLWRESDREALYQRT